VLSMLSARPENQFQLAESMPPDVRLIHAELIKKTKSKTPGAKALFKLPGKVLTDEEKRRFADSEDFDRFTASEKLAIAVRMMLKYNKVTHIYELIKATGSPSQLSFNRETRIWQRNEAIARKHNHEISVDLSSGTLKTGDVHAPMIYHTDPRHDSPVDLTKVIHERIHAIDPLIIKTWMLHDD
jgi:hypothetical protein